MPQNECKRPKTKTNFIYRCMLWNLINYGLRIYVCVWVCARGMREQQFAQQQPQHKGEFDNKHDNCLRCKWTEKCVFDSTETLTSAPSVLQAFVVDAAIAIILATCNTALTDASYLYRSKICTCICVLSLVYYFFFNHYLQLLSVWQEQCGNHEFNHNKNNKKLKKKMEKIQRGCIQRILPPDVEKNSWNRPLHSPCVPPVQFQWKWCSQFGCEFGEKFE